MIQEAHKTIPRLAALYPKFKGEEIEVELNGTVETNAPESQLAFALAEPASTTGGRMGGTPLTLFDVLNRFDTVS